METDKDIMKIRRNGCSGCQKGIAFLCITSEFDKFLDEQEIAARQLKSIQRWINTRLER